MANWQPVWGGFRSSVAGHPGQAKARAVVLPTFDHLSRDPVLCAELRAQITQTGAAICLLPPAANQQRDQKPAG